MRQLEQAARQLEQAAQWAQWLPQAERSLIQARLWAVRRLARQRRHRAAARRQALSHLANGVLSQLASHAGRRWLQRTGALVDPENSADRDEEGHIHDDIQPEDRRAA